MLKQENYEAAARVLGCEVEAIIAVTKKEAAGIGFYPDSQRCILKFEGHRFHALTNGKYDKEYPTLSYPCWTEKYSHYGELAYDRFNRAFALDKAAAMKATSWGMFQIMGEHYATCGFKTVDDFVTAMRGSEVNQLMAFCSLVIRMGWVKHLKGFKIDLVANTRAFALAYNGKGYARNKYDTDIAAYYLKLKK